MGQEHNDLYFLYAAIVTADHGNADEMYEIDKKTGLPAIGPDGVPKAKTSHTLSKVSCVFYDNTAPGAYEVVPGEYGLSSFASTICTLLGLEPLASWDPAMIRML